MAEPAIGERCNVEILDLSHDGQGIGRCGPSVIFVPEALPGEKVEAVVLRRVRQHWLARLERIVRSSPKRQRPPCHLARRCGGCSLQHLDSVGQLEWKRHTVIQSLERLAGLSCPVAPVIGAGFSLGYRNRAIIPLERNGRGPVRCGYYRRHSHRIVNLTCCPVLDPRLDALVAPIKDDLSSTDWPVDRDCREGGGLRHLGLRIGVRTGELLITLISSHDRLPGLTELARTWMERWPSLAGVCLNLQPEPSNLLMGAETRVVSGCGYIHERFANLTYRIAADTFFQVFVEQAERVFPFLLEVMNQSPHPGRVVDAYCGNGCYSLPMAAAGWQVLGLELNQRAVSLARDNARLNGLDARCSFRSCDVAVGLAEVLPRADLLFLDPPRRGLAAEVIRSVLEQPPLRVVYLSCDPASQSRDLKALVGSGPYSVERVQPFDFFPQTSHVECLVVLNRAG
ncbi:MAG: 23S rRNA (uracil(1939)-C(5))-methyltransferase RlmD [Cyanobacteriota bacterium]|nr:23S rRNA (uracil(1939)-C(5))-methyltransferase RlmD [Cyanobacteriota bacterium]